MAKATYNNPVKDSKQGGQVNAGFYNKDQRSPQMMEWMQDTSLSPDAAAAERMCEIKEAMRPTWEHDLRHRLTNQERFQGGYTFCGHGGKHDPDAKK